MPEWLDSGDKIASIVGGASGLLSLVVSVMPRRAQTDRSRSKRRFLLHGAVASGVLIIPAQLLKVIPTVYCLAGLAVALLVTHFVLAARDHVPFDPLIVKLLKAQKLHAEGIKYRFGSLHAPTIGTVYVEQRGRGSADDSRPAEAVPLTTLLTAAHSSLLECGPGGGKSTFVTRSVASSTEYWTTAGRFRVRARAPHGPHVALYLPATMLVGCSVLDGQLAFARELGVELPRELLERRPWRGVRWLLLIDGLDEIQDTHEQSRVLHTLHDFLDEGSHRVIVTTRPLSPTETNELVGARHFRLRSFTPHDLETFALTWARARSQLGSPAAFLEKLRTSDLTALTRVPLIATMTALLYEDDPQRELPRNRTKLYEEFVALLRSGRVPERQVTGSDPFSRWMGEHLDELLHTLARHTVFSSAPHLFEEASKWLRTRLPQLPESHWRGLLRSELTASGLLLQRGTDVEFLHQSIAEYLAARPDSGTFDFASWRVLMRDASTRSFALFLVGRRPQLAGWVSRELVDSGSCNADFVAAGRVLADGATVDEHLFSEIVTSVLSVYAHDEALLSDGLEILVTLVNGPGVLEKLRTFCADETQGEWQRALLADALLPFPAADGLALLRRIVVSPTVSKSWTRTWVLQRLVAEGDLFGQHLAGAEIELDGQASLTDIGQVGIEVARKLLSDPRLPAEDRITVAIRLLDAGDPSGFVLVNDRARSAGTNSAARFEAASALHRNNCEGATDALHRLGCDPNLFPDTRLDAIRLVSESSPDLARTALHSLLRDTEIERRQLPLCSRPHMVFLQVTLDKSAGLRSAHRLALRPQETDSDRLDFARMLNAFKSPLAYDALRSIAHDKRVAAMYREHAAKILFESGQADGADLYVEIGLDRDLPAGFRARVATGLREHGDPRSLDVLRAMASTRGGDDQMRVAACSALIEMGAAAGAKELLDIASDSEIGIFTRELALDSLSRAVGALPEGVAAKLIDLLHQDVELFRANSDPTRTGVDVQDRIRSTFQVTTIGLSCRMKVAVALAGAGHERAASFVTEFVTADALELTVTRAAVRHLCATSRAEDLLRLLGRLERNPVKQRLVAGMIAWGAEHVEALVAARALVTDVEAPALLRRSVAGALTWLHDPYGTEYLRTLKGDMFAARTLFDAKLGDAPEIPLPTVKKFAQVHQEPEFETAVLKSIALDPSRPADRRLEAAEEIWQRGDREISHALTALAADLTVDFATRVAATSRMLSFDEVRGVELAKSLLDEDGLSWEERHSLAKALIGSSGSRGANVLLKATRQDDALEILGDLEDRGSDHAAVLASVISRDERFAPQTRLDAVEYATSHGRMEAFDSLDSIAKALRATPNRHGLRARSRYRRRSALASRG